jgi:hypothetical protein
MVMKDLTNNQLLALYVETESRLVTSWMTKDEPACRAYGIAFKQYRKALRKRGVGIPVG